MNHHVQEKKTEEPTECGSAGGCNCGPNCECSSECCETECCSSENSCGEGCGCEAEQDTGAYIMQKARLKLLIEKISKELDKTQGKEYEALAASLIEISRAEHTNNEALSQKREKVAEQFSKLFE